jgi:hypothetical protein
MDAPHKPADLPKFNTVAGTDDVFNGGARWNLTNLDNQKAHVELKPRLATSDLRVTSSCNTLERVLPEWSGAENILHLSLPKATRNASFR